MTRVVGKVRMRWCLRICRRASRGPERRASVWPSVLYSPDDGEAALCRQPDFILWPPPKLQHVGNKPFSSNPQTVQQSMGNYVCDRWASLSISPSHCLSRCPLCILSPSPLSLSSLLILPVSFFLPGSPLPPPSLTCIPSSTPCT